MAETKLEKPWKEMSTAEKSELIKAGRAKAKESKEAAAKLEQEKAKPPEPVVVPPVVIQEALKVEDPKPEIKPVTPEAMSKLPLQQYEVEPEKVNEPKPVERSFFQKFFGLNSKPKAKPEQPLKAIKVGGRKWWLVIAGAVVIALGLTALFMFGTSRNAMVGFVAVATLMGGGTAVYLGWQKQEEGEIFTPNGKIDKKFKANCLNVYPDEIKFENMPKELIPPGQPRKCRNDGKFYWVNIFNQKEGKLLKFKLPDTIYRSPAEFSNNINIPAHRELMKARANLFEKIAPGLIVLAMFVVAILMIATNKPPTSGNVTTMNQQPPMAQQVGN
jgi:hypothetical protein